MQFKFTAKVTYIIEALNEDGALNEFRKRIERNAEDIAIVADMERLEELL